MDKVLRTLRGRYPAYTVEELTRAAWAARPPDSSIEEFNAVLGEMRAAVMLAVPVIGAVTPEGLDRAEQVIREGFARLAALAEAAP